MASALHRHGEVTAEPDASPSRDVEKLLERYVQLHNRAAAGVGSELVAKLFARRPLIAIEGAGLSTLRQEAMLGAFRRHEIVLWKIGHEGEDVAFASYAWRDRPRIGGVIRLQRQGGRILRLTLRPGYSRIFALIAKPADPGIFGEPGGIDAFAS